MKPRFVVSSPGERHAFYLTERGYWSYEIEQAQKFLTREAAHEHAGQILNIAYVVEAVC